MLLGRSSVSYEVEPKYVAMMKSRFHQATLQNDSLVVFEERDPHGHRLLKKVPERVICSSVEGPGTVAVAE